MPPDPGREQAVNDTANAIKPMLGPTCPTDARVVVETVMARYILGRAEQAYSDPAIKAALSSERPWDMVRLIEPGLEVEAVTKAVLRVAGDVAYGIDPSGQLPFFQWRKDQILQLFEAVIWAWEESQGRIGLVSAVVPQAQPNPVTMLPPIDPMVMAGVKLPATQYRGPIIDDEIPF